MTRPLDLTRRSALAALQRTNDALDGWGAPGQLEWYMNLALGINCPAPDEYTTGYLTGMECAARGRSNNYGGVRAMWAQIATVCAEQKIDPPKHLGDLQRQFSDVSANLGRMQFPPPTLNPLKTPATF